MRAPAEMSAGAAQEQRLEARVELLLRSRLQEVYKRRDQLFVPLMLLQWAFAIGISVWTTPYTYEGVTRTLHPHVLLAIVLGGVLSLPPVILAAMRPGWEGTRHVVAFAQMSWSAFLIHLTGGRIETHFHVFGSLAFLAYYRDWKVLATGSVVVVVDHLARGAWWPESVYGISNPEWWRTLEHGFWVLFEDTVLLMGILENQKEMRALVVQQVALEGVHESVEQMVDERTQELAQSRERYRELVESTRTIPWQIIMPERRFSYVGPQAASLLGCPAELWSEPGFMSERIHPDDQKLVYRQLRSTFEEGHDAEIQVRLRRDDCQWIWVRFVVSRGESASGPCLRGHLQDVTERRHLESELQQAQKLESVGRLASGIAHEINTPVQYVGDSVHFLRDGIDALLTLSTRLGEVAVQPEPSTSEERARQRAEAEEAADLAYLRDRMPKAIARSIDGLERVAKIVRAMKEFAHPDQTEQAAADLTRALEATLTIATNEYKYVATLETHFEELPHVVCNISEVNQAVLNIVVNAAHAIGDVVKGTDERGVIRVSTRQEQGFAVIEISDTGGGIPEAIQGKIFDPFFTTKEVGKGTGQGLAIARSVIVEKHGGSLVFTSARGKGTTFTLRLPIAGRPDNVAKAA